MANDEKQSRPLAVYSISADLPFVDSLASGILELTENDPARLTAVRVLLPTRRACRSLREAFLRLSKGKPILLPHMTPIGDVDEDELQLTGDSEADSLPGVDPLALPPAVSPLRRQLLLARLIMARGDTSPDQAVRLGLELARLLDQLHTERLDFSRFADLVPDTYSVHWQETLKFLEILTHEWPAILASEGTIDAADRRNRLLDSQTRLWRDHPPATPVIAAGSTGSIPATADLLSTIAGLPEGRVVLPGLDRDLPDTAWQALEPHHPQFGLSHLLDHFGLARSQVRDWPAPSRTPANLERRRFVSTALTPAQAMVASSEPVTLAAINGIRLCTCPTAREEAGVIALAMRETLETPEKTVALITPDRSLARRVASELLRWHIDVDDSAGQPLSQTAAGSFFRATARMVCEHYAPVALLAALKHPLASGGMERAGFRRLVCRLEIAALRGPRPAPGIDGLRQALTEQDAPAEDLMDLIDSIDRRTEALHSLVGHSAIPLADLVRAHVALVERLAGNGSDADSQPMWQGDDGEALAGFVSELMQHSDVMSGITLAAYPAFLDGLMAGRAVRPRFGRHPRVFIWGLLEARLQRADLIILGGLNEGTWPPQADTGPWLSRPMMAELGLSQPERQIGLTAHDFVQAFAAEQVLITRAERVDGTPTVASRWLMRLDNSLSGAGIGGGLPQNHSYLDWFDALDRPDQVTPVKPPEPRPPVEARPRQLSVTAIETWIRDPYAVFARRILRLQPLDPLDADPGAADRGTLIHKILETFMRTYPDSLPPDAGRELMNIGEIYFRQHITRPGVQAFWWPRFLRIADWFVAFETARRNSGISSVLIERKGDMVLDVGSSSFHLTAQADRIDRLADGSLAVMDYKTGQPPTAPQVESWLVPQLSLEAAMAKAGAFPGLPSAPVSELVYLRLSGGRIAGEEKRLKLDVDDVAKTAVERLRGYIAAFDKPDMPYRSRPRPMFKSRFGDYDHLARVREWSSIDGEDGS